MKQALTIFCMSFFVLGGCASKKELTAVESVEDAKERVDVTSKYIDDASKQVQEFQKSLADLSKDATKSKEMRGKDKFSHVLSGIVPRLDQIKAELQQMKAANTATWEQYRTHIDSADAKMRESFTNMMDEGKAE